MAITSVTANTQSGSGSSAASTALIDSKPPSRVNAPWMTRSPSSGTFHAASPRARKPSSRSRAVSRPPGPGQHGEAAVAERDHGAGQRLSARPCSPAAVSTPSRSWPTATARPPELAKAASSARSASRAAVSSVRLPIRITARARWARISATYPRSAASVAAVLDVRTPGGLAAGDLDGRDGGEVRVRDVVHDHADHRALPGGDGSGLQVGGVSELGDGLVDALRQLWPDAARALVHHPGRGGQRHPGQVGDVLQRHPADPLHRHPSRLTRPLGQPSVGKYFPQVLRLEGLVMSRKVITVALNGCHRPDGAPGAPGQVAARHQGAGDIWLQDGSRPHPERSWLDGTRSGCGPSPNGHGWSADDEPDQVLSILRVDVRLRHPGDQRARGRPMKAIQAGKHVKTEKPVAATLDGVLVGLRGQGRRDYRWCGARQTLPHPESNQAVARQRTGWVLRSRSQSRYWVFQGEMETPASGRRGTTALGTKAADCVRCPRTGSTC